jgi:hypothetical protein
MMYWPDTCKSELLHVISTTISFPVCTTIPLFTFVLSLSLSVLFCMSEIEEKKSRRPKGMEQDKTILQYKHTHKSTFFILLF